MVVTHIKKRGEILKKKNRNRKNIFTYSPHIYATQKTLNLKKPRLAVVNPRKRFLPLSLSLPYHYSYMSKPSKNVIHHIPQLFHLLPLSHQTTTRLPSLLPRQPPPTTHSSRSTTFDHKASASSSTSLTIITYKPLSR